MLWGDVYSAYTSGCLDANKARWTEASFQVLSNPTQRALLDLPVAPKQGGTSAPCSFREEYQLLLSDEKRLLEQREQDRCSLDAKLRRQESHQRDTSTKPRGFSLMSPKVKQPLSSCVCRFGKETSRPQSLRQHVAGRSTDRLCFVLNVRSAIYFSKPATISPSLTLNCSMVFVPNWPRPMRRFGNWKLRFQLALLSR
jgi:hypothetical protein